ncbi:hypothetical protein ACGFNU_39055 [Spirillospora sp. NPDC048911]|uniref:hypothetical protein n=1 Tax=Spirillospora sp. NPDC048911 TaxID=3364527 RepID=UPI003723A44A
MSIQDLAFERGAAPDPGPYEPEPGGQPTVAAPEVPPTNRIGLAQIVHALAADGDRVWEPQDWLGLAAPLLACGAGWPAVADLAAVPGDSAIVAAVARLERQVAVDLGDEDRLPFWDVVAGLIARAWRLGVGGSVWDAVTQLGAHWWDLRGDPQGRHPSGVVAFNCASWLYELAAFQDIDPHMTVLLCETERLLPPYSVTASFCAAAVSALRD